MQLVISLILPFFKALAEVIANELFKILTAPDTVKPEVDPHLKTITGNVVSPDVTNRDLVSRFGGLSAS
jgi:hypothetical protein